MLKRYLTTLLLALFSVVAIQAQKSGENSASAPTKVAVPRFEAETALAKSALEAHGGAKLKAMRNLVVNGAVDVTTSAIAQAIPATFVTIFSGDKYRLEINNPFQPIKQVFDGINTSTTIRGGFTLPPINRLGFPVLPRIGEANFIITPLPDSKKKKKGFRITSPEGYYTDFYLNENTNQIKGYDSTYDINGRKVTTSVEIDKYRAVDGILVPERYVQRFDTEQLTVYANFKAREILVNSVVPDSVFVIGN
ncbi:MAG: hypothetical protein ABR535_01540 [Pyrinomonadaceae bacterium]